MTAVPPESAASIPMNIQVITLGRMRPGFDRVWSATVSAKCGEYLLTRYHATVEQNVAKNDTHLQSILAGRSASEADLLIFLQPSIADGTLVNTIAQCAANRAMLFWATTEKAEGNVVSSNSLVGTHLFVATLAQYDISAGYVYGDPDDLALRRKLHDEIVTLVARARIGRARVGLIGGHAPGFIDLHVDPRHLSAHTGATLGTISMTQFLSFFHDVSSTHIEACYEELMEYRLPTRDIPAAGERHASIMRTQARYWATYAQIMTEEHWSSCAVRCWPDLPQHIEHWPYLAISIMLNKGYAIAIEGDADAALGMEVARVLAPGAVYLSDWLAHTDDSVTLWHGGALDPQLCVADGNSPYRAHIAAHFNNKMPAVIEGDVQENTEVTLWRMWQSKGCYYSTAIEGVTAVPTQHFRGSTALVACQSPVSLDEWLRCRMRYGMPHHILMTLGHFSHRLRQFAQQMKWKWIE